MTQALIWKDGAPYSEAFGDIYFNPQQGLEESRHVFIDGNNLNERFSGARHFTIAELGFGTGLNLLAAWQRFRETAPPNAMLHYISFERYPLTSAQMRQSASRWPELQSLAEAIFDRLSLCGEGIYRLHAQQLTLTLVIGDAAAMLPQMEFAADAWFLDGFAPAKNPQLWTDALLMDVAQHTRTGGTVATFTSAGAVRRALAAGGFEVRKVPGFGTKREMTIATMPATGCPAPLPPAQVRIAGGGIAGCAAAYSLARRGIGVALYDPSGIAAGASGNAAGALYPPLHKQMSATMHAYFDAFRYVSPLLESLTIEPVARGMLKLPVTKELATLYPMLPEHLGLPAEALHWLSRADASALAGTALATGGLYLPHSCAVNVPALCRALTSHPLIHLHPHALAPDDDDTPTLIACATASQHWHASLPLHANRGQVSIIAAPHVNQRPNCIISHRGYAIALPDGGLLTGATYARGNTDITPRAADDEENISTTKEFLPTLLKPNAQAHISRASMRTVTPDRMPIVGALPRRGHYISTGHGSRGLLSAPMAGEWLADLLCGTPHPLRRDSAALWQAKRYATV